eukprot:14439655-Alexandrium_andersonii.AAC.1
MLGPGGVAPQKPFAGGRPCRTRRRRDAYSDGNLQPARTATMPQTGTPPQGCTSRGIRTGITAVSAGG